VYAVLLLACGLRSPPAEPTSAALGPATGPTLRERIGDHPFVTPIDAPATVAAAAGEGSFAADPASCGACHGDHHAEWALTTHAAAIRDPQFLAELAKPGQPRWLCLNCHAPTVPQRDILFTLDTRLLHPDDLSAVDARPNPDFDPARAAEGVGCATCHVRRDADGAGVVVGPRGSGRAPHRVRQDAESLRGICVRCHSPGDIVLTPQLPCWFETAEELAAGPTPEAGCPDCHMPEAVRPAAVGGPERTLRQHDWVGGGVPKSADGYRTLTERGWRPALDVALRADPFEVTLTNARAAHLLPTGDPERHLRVEARVEDADGRVRGREVLRIGQTWDWGDAATGRPARRLADNRLAQGEPRVWRPGLSAEGATALVVEVAHVRMTPDTAAFVRDTELDAPLRALWPGAAGLLPRIDEVYPLATWVAELRLDLASGGLSTRSVPELIARSEAFLGLPLAEKERLLATP